MTIAEFIAEDLAARTRSGAPPEDLTLQAIADLYAVSLTPVRHAVARLIEERILLKRDNGRLEVNPRKIGRGAVRAPEAPTRPEELQDRISSWVVRQSLAGTHVYLRESATADALGVGRSTVRESFRRLEGSGLLEHVPRHGWRLRPFRREDLDHFLQAREALELLALKQARSRLDESALKKMLDGNCLPVSKTAMPKIDNSIHRYLIQASGNPYIEDFFNRHQPYFDAIFRWESLDRDAAIEATEQHRRILKACLDRDWKEARTALGHHIRTNHPVLERLDEIPTVGIPGLADA